MPEVYRDGCVEPKLEAGALSKVNGSRIAGAFAQCSNLQHDTVTWAQCYIMDLGGEKLPKACGNIYQRK